MVSRRGRGQVAVRQLRSAIESLERRELFSAVQLASVPIVDAFPALAAPSGTASAAPGQANGTTIFGGGIYGASATSYSKRADGLPVLNSRPSAPFSVFLDFDGWSGTGYGGAQSFTPYSIDGVTTTFNATEQANIAEGWRRIAAYMATFDVNVTTVQPASGNNFSWSVISNSVSSGYSWLSLGSFAPSAFNPSGDLLARTSAIIHEIGHNFSLQHQSLYDAVGTKTDEYRGPTDSLHGVLMGLDYNGTPPKWIYGHPATSNVSAQDDIAIIASKIKAYQGTGGDGMRADDYGNIASAAATLPAGTGSVISSGFGVIERIGDADAFKLPTAAGWYTISVTPDSPSALDAKLEIYDSVGNKLAVVDDPTKIDASVTLRLPTGANYAIVRSHGNYGDIGAYEIKVTTASAVTGPTTNAEPPPQNVTAALATGTGITVSWAATDTATAYQVERSSDGVNFTTVGTVTTTDYTDTSLNGSSRYVYQVRSKSATGVGVASSQVAIVNRPSAVTGLRTTLISSSQVVVDWLETPGGGGETGFRVERSLDGTTWTTAGSTAPNVVIFNNTGLTNAGSYFYRVIPTSSLGDGPASAVVSVTSRLPAVAGLNFTAKTSTSLTLGWTDAANDAGYKLERSTNGTTWSTLATLGTNATSYTNTGLSAVSEYYYRISAIDSTGIVGLTSPVIFTATPATTPPTAPWTSADIGSPAGAGATSLNASTGVFTIVASGTDIGGTSDQFRFTYQNYTGDGTITARVVTEENTDPWAKVGVMFRDSTAAGSAHAFMFISPSNGAGIESRSALGGASTTVNTTNIGGVRPVAPYWVRLTRAGNVFTGYASSNGTTWTLVGSATVTLSTNALVGLAAVSDDATLLNTSTLDQVTIKAANINPVAVADSATTTANTAVTINVLSNDTDANGDTLTISSTSTPAHGTTAIVAGGVKYTPATNYSGSDSFTYTISDGNGGTATATVSLTVQPSNLAPTAVNDIATTAEDTAITLDVASNDTDPNGDTLTVSAVTSPAHGTAAIVAGSVKYTPAADYNGPDAFSYTVSDGKGGTSIGTVNVTVTPVNDNPVANTDAASLPENGFAIIDVRLNDTDIDGDTLSLTSVAAGAHGTTTINAGKVRYVPAPNYNGTDTFTYVIGDGKGGTATGTVNITISPVNDPPVATDDTLTVAEDAAATDIDVLANDTDPDNDILSILTVGTALHGKVLISAGSKLITYQPDPNYNGPDSFTYTVFDGAGGSNVGTVDVTITPVNDEPVAVDDSVTTLEDKPVNIDVLGNDTDIDLDILTVSAVSSPTHGVATINPNDTIRYTPNPNYNGPDLFTYAIDDGNGGTATATVTINVTPVNDNPVAVTDVITVAWNRANTINLLSNDTDVEGNSLTVTAITAAAHGTASLNSNGSVTYIPVTDYLGADTFTYTLSDGVGGTATGTVTINVVVPNRPPVAVNDTATTLPNLAVDVSVLSNDTDPDADTLAVVSYTAPAHGKVVLGSGGVITYTPTPDYAGPDSFAYTISDGVGSFSTATVSISVQTPNQPPTVATAAKASATTVTGKGVNLTVLGADADTGESSLTYTWSLLSGPAAVTYSANGTNAAKATTATFTTAGAYAFRVTITDPSSATVTSDVSVTVVKTAASVKVTPATATVKVKGTVQLSAKAYDQFGVALVTQPTFTWTVTGGGTVSTTGLFTAPTSTVPAGAVSTVKATSGTLSSTAAVTVQPTTPATPTGLVAVKNTNRSVKLSWKDVSTNEQGYYVDTSTNGTTWTLVFTKAAVSGSGTTTTYTTPIYAAGKRYFRIRAFNAGGIATSASVSLTL